MPFNNEQTIETRLNNWAYTKASVEMECGPIAKIFDTMVEIYISANIGFAALHKCWNEELFECGNFDVSQLPEFERYCVAIRLYELQEQDCLDNVFNVDLLRAINRHLFQDMPQISQDAARIYSPGIFRKSLEGTNYDWMKYRKLTSINQYSYVAYSRMDAAALQILDDIMKQADPQMLGQLDLEAFIQKIAEIYVTLDYVHPFRDGNSRTLREFTRRLARQSGYFIDWAEFNKNQVTRDLLCIARDTSVYRLAKDNIVNPETLRDATYSYDQFSQNKDMAAILSDVITPLN